MTDLPDSMYDYRYDREEETSDEIRYIGDCEFCGIEIYSNQDYRYRNDALMHDDCVDQYEEEEEY